jgi:hypothetical protein
VLLDQWLRLPGRWWPAGAGTAQTATLDVVGRESEGSSVFAEHATQWLRMPINGKQTGPFHCMFTHLH